MFARIRLWPISLFHRRHQAKHTVRYSMKKFGVLVLFFGVLLIVAGAMEFKLRLRSSSMPAQYSVASLEGGAEVTNLSGVIDSHYAVYPAMVFAYRTRDADDAKPTGNEFVENI